MILKQRYEELVDANQGFMRLNMAMVPQASEASTLATKIFSELVTGNSNQDTVKRVKVPEVIMFPSTKAAQMNGVIGNYEQDKKYSSSFQSARRVTLDEEDEKFVPDRTLFCLPVETQATSNNALNGMGGNVVNESEDDKDDVFDARSISSCSCHSLDLDQEFLSGNGTMFCLPVNDTKMLLPDDDEVCTDRFGMDGTKTYKKRPQKVDISDDDILSYYHSI